MKQYTRTAPVLCRVYAPDQAFEASLRLSRRRDLRGYALWAHTPDGWQLLGYAVASDRQTATTYARSEFFFLGLILVVIVNSDELALLKVIKFSTPVSLLCLSHARMNSLLYTPAQMLREQVRGDAHV